MQKYDGIPVPDRVYRGRPVKHDFESIKIGQCVFYQCKSKKDAQTQRRVITASAYERGFVITTRIQERKNGNFRVGVWMVKKPK